MPNAAQSIYPHLPSAEREPIKQSEPKLAEALYPALVPKPERRLSPDELREAWHEHLWALSGIRRKR
jgi:hypothetical protein